MSLDTCFDALRFLARSSEPEETRLMTAAGRINELLEQVKLRPDAERAILAALNKAVKREAEIGSQDAASFWHAISQNIASRLAALGND
jgi:predicted kinase